MKKIVLFLIFSLAAFANAQDANKLPKFFKDLTSAKNDSASVEAYRNLCFNYSLYNSDSGIYFGTKGLEIALRINFIKGIGDCYNSIGWCYIKKGDYQKAKENLLLAKKYFEQTSNKCYSAVVFANLGNMFFDQRLYADALEHFLQSVKLNETCPDEGFKSSGIYSIGTIYNAQREYEKAIKYFKEANEINISKSDFNKTADCINGIGNAYLGLKNFDSALVYFGQSVELYAKYNNINGLAFANESIGSTYANQQNYDKALAHYFIARDYFIKLNNKVDVCYELLSIGQVYINKGDYKLAVENLQAALQLADSNHFSNLKQEILSSLADAYYQNKAYKSAYEYFHQAAMLKDSLLNINQQTKLEELKTRFETEKKDRQIELLNKDKQLQQAESQRQKQLKNVFITGAIVLLLVALILFNRYQIKKKAAKEMAAKNEIIRREKERAEQSEKYKQQFLANMSHEIRTPLNAILGMTELLEEAPLHGQDKKYLDAIKSSSSNLLVIINDILDISKMEAGKMELEKTPFNLHRLIQNVYHSFVYKTKEKNVEFNYHIDKNVPAQISSDSGRLSQVLMNLVGNAVKFTAAGKIELVVSVKTETENHTDQTNTVQQLKFSVRDTGIGIAPDKQEKIFESFTQSHSGTTRQYGGTGLGLTISKNLVELFGGEIAVESNEGQGSLFSFYIPVEIYNNEFSDINQDSGKDVLVKKALNVKEDKHQTINVLLVEDNEYNRLLVVDALKKKIQNININVTHNGKEAIDFLQTVNADNWTLDLILMDIQMPELDGYATTKKIRTTFSSPLKDTPVIAVTASVIKSDIEKCLSAGMNDFIAKPFKIKELVTKVIQHSGATVTEKKYAEERVYIKSNHATDLQYLHDFTEGDEDEIKKYITIFLEHIPVRLMETEKAIRAENVINAVAILHGIKPLIASVGLVECEKIITEMEYNKNDLKPNQLLPKFLQIRKQCLKAIEELSSRLTQTI